MEKEIKNIIGVLVGDVFVDVDITYKPQRPLSKEESMTLDSVNRELGYLAHEIKTEIKDKIRTYFKAD